MYACTRDSFVRGRLELRDVIVIGDVRSLCVVVVVSRSARRRRRHRLTVTEEPAATH